MPRLRSLLLLLLTWVSVASGQQLIQGNRTIVGWFNICASGGAANSYTCALAYPLPGYVANQCFVFRANHSNTSAATLNVDGRGAKPIRKWVSGTLTDVTVGDITTGQYIEVCHDGSVMQVQSGSGGTGGGAVIWGDGLADGATASTEPRFLTDGGGTDLVCGSGTQGKMQVMDTGELQYCDGATTAILRRGQQTQTGLTWNVTPGTCTGDANGGKLTLVGTEIRCASDVGGGAGGAGDLTAFGLCTTGDCAVAANPLTGFLMGTRTAPGTPAAGQTDVYIPPATKTLTTKDDAGVERILVQPHADVANEVLGSITPSGGVIGKTLASTNLTDSAQLARRTGPQTVEDTLLRARYLPLGAASGSVTPNPALADTYHQLTVTGALSFQTPTVTGPVPYAGQDLCFVLKSATPQPLTWSAGYTTGFGIPLPTSTTGNGSDGDMLCYLYNGTTWDFMVSTKPTAPWPPKQVQVLANPTSVTPNPTLYDEIVITGQAQALTLNPPSPVPTQHAKYFAYYIFSATPQPLTWNTGTNGYAAEAGILLPPTTPSGSYILLVFRWNALTSKLALVGASISAETRSGTTTEVATVSGTKVTNKQLAFDTNGNVVASATDIGAGGTGTLQLSIVGYKIPSANPATADVSENHDRLLFDASTSECGVWQGVVPADYASAPVLRLLYTMTSATAGGISINAAVKAVTPGDAVDIQSKTFATVNNCDDATVPGTAGHLDVLTCPLTNADTMAANDLLQVQLCRAVADSADTASGDLEAVGLVLNYTR